MRLITLLLFVSSLVLTGCSPTESTDASITSDVRPTPAPQAGMGRISLALTDAPVDDAYAVVVQFSKVSIRGVDASDDIVFDLDPAMSVDLLTLQGANSQTVITDEDVPAGSYDEIRLFIDSEEGVEDSYIVLEQGGAQPVGFALAFFRPFSLVDIKNGGQDSEPASIDDRCGKQAHPPGFNVGSENAEFIVIRRRQPFQPLGSPLSHQITVSRMH